MPKSKNYATQEMGLVEFCGVRIELLRSDLRLIEAALDTINPDDVRASIRARRLAATFNYLAKQKLSKE